MSIAAAIDYENYVQAEEKFAAAVAILERMRATDIARLVREIKERAAVNGPVRASPSPQEERSYEPKRKIEV